MKGSFEISKAEAVRVLLEYFGPRFANVRPDEVFGIYESITIYFTTDPKEPQEPDNSADFGKPDIVGAVKTVDDIPF